jgi:hypothetical protein
LYLERASGSDDPDDGDAVDAHNVDGDDAEGARRNAGAIEAAFAAAGAEVWPRHVEDQIGLGVLEATTAVSALSAGETARRETSGRRRWHRCS